MPHFSLWFLGSKPGRKWEGTLEGQTARPVPGRGWSQCPPTLNILSPRKAPYDSGSKQLTGPRKACLRSYNTHSTCCQEDMLQPTEPHADSAVSSKVWSSRVPLGLTFQRCSNLCATHTKGLLTSKTKPWSWTGISGSQLLRISEENQPTQIQNTQ